MNANPRHSVFMLLCAMLLACAGQQTEIAAPTAAATEATQPAPQATPVPEPGPATVAAAPAAVVSAPDAKPASITVRDGLSTPESVFYDAAADVYLISNINGAPLEADDNGFISRVAPDGTIVALKWIDGAKDDVKLSAPKGMTIVGGVLYVSDIDHVRKFDAKTGESKGEIAIKGATFLNDVASDANGTVYVTDSGLKPDFSSSGSDAVYAIVKNKAKALIKTKDLKGPNGLLVDDAGVWVCTFGANEIYNVKSGKKTDVKTVSAGGLDGLVKTADGRLLVSSWAAKQVLASSASGEWTPVVSDINGPADIGYDSKRNRVLLPAFMDSFVQILPL
jgi:sugar lactone lactonase YvrE